MLCRGGLTVKEGRKGAERTRQEDPTRPRSDHLTERPEPGPAILIVGAWREEAFVPAEVLICADTLTAEAAVRRWHEIHLTASSAADPASEAGRSADLGGRR